MISKKLIYTWTMQSNICITPIIRATSTFLMITSTRPFNPSWTLKTPISSSTPKTPSVRTTQTILDNLTSLHFTMKPKNSTYKDTPLSSLSNKTFLNPSLLDTHRHNPDHHYHTSSYPINTPSINPYSPSSVASKHCFVCPHQKHPFSTQSVQSLIFRQVSTSKHDFTHL